MCHVKATPHYAADDEGLFTRLGDGESLFTRLGDGESLFTRLGDGESLFTRLGDGESLFTRLGDGESLFTRLGDRKVCSQDCEMVNNLFTRLRRDSKRVCSQRLADGQQPAHKVEGCLPTRLKGLFTLSMHLWANQFKAAACLTLSKCQLPAGCPVAVHTLIKSTPPPPQPHCSTCPQEHEI